MGRKGICSELVLTGRCERGACPFLHDVSLFCRQCSYTSPNQQAAEKHFKSWPHKQLSRNCQPYCDLCNELLAGAELLGRGLNERALWERHKESDAHRERAERDFYWLETPFPAYRETTEPKEGHVRCDICHFDVVDDRWEYHIAEVGHRVKRILSVRRQTKRHQFNGPGVSVSLLKEGINFGIIDVSSLRNTSNISKGLTVIAHTNGISIIGAKLRSVIEDRSSNDTVPFTVSASPRAMSRGQRTNIQVNFVVRDRNLVGVFTDHVEVQFRDRQRSRNFVICRVVRAEVGNREALELLKPKVEYHKPAPKPATVIKSEVMETVGDPPEDPFKVTWKRFLPEYRVPAEVLDMVVGKNPKGLIEQVKQKLMPKKLDLATYGQHWQNMLWLEELQQRIFNAIQWKRFPSRSMVDFTMKVPGLAEKRPSVIVGDLIKIRLHDERVIHGGYVHRVDGRGAYISLNYKFPFSNRFLYDVEFTLNRLPFRRQHQAVLTKEAVKKRFLFPEWQDVTPQEMAISRILSMGPGSAPFVVHGPFGTGKTTTLVEAIQQLYARDNDVRILACAPSNSAADNIATRLKNVGRSNLLRLNATSREYETLEPPELKQFHSDFGLTGMDPELGVMRFHYPTLEAVKKFKIVVTTCVTAGVPAGLGVNPGHFDWIFIDEAGQAAESEVLIPLLSFSNHNTNVVLCGDHKQLGPIIHSPISKGLGHSKSYLLRLMELEMYHEHGTKGQKDVTVVKLRHNFRNHPAILQFPNEQFYSGDLIAGGDPMTTNRLIGWTKMPNPNFPIKFHGVVGKDQREDASPSYFNSYEVLEVKYIVEEIMSSVSWRFSGKDIGIIAPYSAQCSKIRKTLDGHKHRDIKVGSVEEFQGQERPIIIISTTRSSSENVAFDLRHTLGFVANPRRLNVAITRAQAGLFIVGNPHILALDPVWRALLNYVRLNKGYYGTPLDRRWDANEEVDLTDKDKYARQRRKEYTANMEALERRIRGDVLRHQGLDAEDRFSDEEDEVVYVSRMEGGGTGWADNI
ncbi:hypothetical protein FRB90_009288 [Tulasnella sp. 427]|nr:hypothetical protein FRB90_009288 [Tulasnella sp. 427]